MPILMGLLLTGIIAGVFAGLLGVGGGIVIVPVLFWVFQFLGVSSSTAMSVATGTSLAIIVATSLSSVRAHSKKMNVDLALLKRWCPFMVLGVAFGGVLSSKLGGVFASGIFGFVAILVSANMLFRAKAKALYNSLPSTLIQGILSFVTGTVSVVMGIGGGTLGVPILTSCNYPSHRAVGTSAAFGLIISIPGVLLTLLLAPSLPDAPFGTYGYINLVGVLLIMPLSVLMAPVGVHLGAKLDEVMLKKVFALFLCISGVRMLFQVF